MTIDDMLLVGDIGGTKTILGLCSPAGGPRRFEREETFHSAEYRSLEEIISHFLRGLDINRVNDASFGVAGPVIDDRAQITNLPWMVDAASIEKGFDIKRVHLLNDLEAIANAVPLLVAEDLFPINHGTADPAGTIAVIAPGTGLGEAFLTCDGRRYQAHPSEGGHASFAPNTKEQRELLAFLQERYEHVSCERVCSGSGIPNIYDFLLATGRYPEPEWLRQALAAAEDRTPVVARAAAEELEALCLATMQLFVEILAGEASNMALKVLATGGVYLGGGIPPRILPQLQEPRFVEAFTRKGRFTTLLSSIPIHVILNPRAALFGAARYGLERLQDA